MQPLLYSQNILEHLGVSETEFVLLKKCSGLTQNLEGNCCSHKVNLQDSECKEVEPSTIAMTSRLL